MATKPCGIITLITDFSLKDPYVGAMKGVIYSIYRNANIVDIVHEVPPYNISAGSYILLTTYKEYPRGTINVAVVDPGVGSGRRAILIISRNYYFIGPDNGILIPAALDDGIEDIIVLTNRKYFRKDISHTFHGRDIFAPVAAHLASGIDPYDLGEPISLNELNRDALNLVCEYKDSSTVYSSIIYIDRFGNLVTGCRSGDFIAKLNIENGDRLFILINSESNRYDRYDLTFYPTFSYGSKGDLIMYPGSMGFIEIAQYLGNASRLLNVDIGDKLWISKM